MNSHLVLLTNFIAPYRIPFFQELAKLFNRFEVLTSIKMESNRKWPETKVDFNVILQKSFSLRRTWRHAHGFSEFLDLHFPYDTLYLLLKLKPNVVISGELGLRTFQAVIFKFIKKDSIIIVWATISEYTEKGRGSLRILLRNWLLPRVDAIIVNGESGARYFHRFGIPGQKIFKIAQTVDALQFSPRQSRQWQDKFKYFLYVGQLIERKGLTHFFDALAISATANANLKIIITIIGDGPQYSNLSSICLPSNVRVKFTGHVPHDELPAYYRQTEFLVFPTLADEWGLVVNEALACGVPVLGSLYSQAVEELINDGKNGWTFRPDHHDEIICALNLALLIPDEKLHEMRVAARESVKALTPKIAASKIVDTIRWCCSQKVITSSETD